ncbi:right-handed parallel beta-helix repeat-containing protein, partial [Methanobrevibacter sp.]|uniref:right-handed parallel beta-helix repeat-containing protein n=1 Tax=Methanobrevibacter sp. TaxID=66852 RepID=UPI00388D9EF9
MSFVSASDNITGDVEGDTILSASDDIVVEENDDVVSVEKSSDSVLGVCNDDQSDENESENLSNNAQVLGLVDNQLDENDSVILASKNTQLLGAPNNDPVLSAPNVLNFFDYRDSVDDIRNAIRDATGPTIIYLNGGTYTGRINFDISDQFPSWQGYSDNYRKNKKVTLSDIKIIGGSESNPNQKAAINPRNSWESAINFVGYHEPIQEDPQKRAGYFSTSGYDLVNFEIINITSSYRFFSISGGSMDGCVLDGCTSLTQFFNAVGNYHDNTQILIKNCNITNSHQTYVGDDYVKDGTGQLGAVFGVNMVGCNFINTSSAQHGGALCIADESEWGSARVTTTLYDCSFINVTSRWFAIYIHGNFRTSYASITSPEIIDNCKFINCNGTGEYSGAIGISHDNLIVRNSEFVNCSGGQGAAIMVGGIDPDHDGFSGRNTKGNNVTIDNCTFTNNVANLSHSESFCIGIYSWDTSVPKDYTQYTYYRKLGENNYVEDPNGNYYNKHDPITFYPKGNAGAVYVFGNDTKILNTKFNNNSALNGGAIYIVGHRTLIENSTFHDHESKNGTIYIQGNNTKIKNSTFEDNHANQGSAIYILGSYTEISGSTFEKNNCTNGTVYIEGNYTKITSGSNFTDNNASYGGGVYIAGTNTVISGSNLIRNNATLDGGGMYIKGNNTNITSCCNFTENNAINGGGIYLGGTNTLISASNFVGNNATHDGAGMYVRGNNTKAIDGSNFTANNAAHDGAGMYIEGFNTLISNTYFEKNNATNGGGLYIKGNNTNITSSSNFMENNATYGAGAFLEGSNTLINGSIFEKNNATYGAGMFISGNNTKITSKSNFTENNATIGGGMYIEGSNTLVSGSMFEKNNATNGGGMFISGNNTNVTSGSDFIENYAGNGAGMYIDGSYTLVSGSKFERNNATNNGGGMFISGNYTNITSKSNFTENHAVNGAGIYIEGSDTVISGSNFRMNNATNGGGMFISGNNTNVTSGSDFTENYAVNGSGMYIEGSDTLVSGSKFERNNATSNGAGMYIKGSDTVVSDSDFSENNATNGGGMFISGDNTNVTSGSDFSKNEAINGAGMYIEGSNTLVSGSVFSENEAINGGGMFISGNNTNITSKSNFTENEAINGAGIYIEGSNTTISGSNFELNNATDGAGMYINGDNTKIVSGSFTENEADDGAGIYINGKNTEISKSTFEDNYVFDEGAGVFIEGSDTKVSDSNFINNEALFRGAGAYIKGNATEVSGSTFERNDAIYGAGAYIEGKDNAVYSSTFMYNDATEGAGAYLNGSDTVISGSTFEHNDAVNGAGAYIDGNNAEINDSNFTSNKATNGAGAYVKGQDTIFDSSNFTSNTALNAGGAYVNGQNTRFDNSIFLSNNATVDGGGAYVNGQNTTFERSSFLYNNATSGGGAFVKGKDTLVLNNTFDHNNVTYHGGALYIDGSNSNFTSNNFTYNEAVPDNTVSELSGLGGAIFVNGNNTVTYGNDFEHNKARNGSAIYSSGKNFRLENDVFRENQAWSYLLITEADPEKSPYNTNDVKIEVVHIGGDNMINAIHSNASAIEIGLKNVSYVHSSGANLTTNSTRFENPVQGVELSNGGKLLYQDDREYLQNLTIKVEYVGPGQKRQIYYNDTLLTHYFGDVYVNLDKSVLEVGNYLVTATHPEDWNYKQITNTASFTILNHADISVEKTSDKFEYFDDDLAYWTITISSANNSTKSTNITFDDLLPSEFEFINYTVVGADYINGVYTIRDGPNKGVNVTYDGIHGFGNITSLANGTNITIIICSMAECNEEKLDHSHNITSNEQNIKLDVNRVTNQTSFKEFDTAIWNFTITNYGDFTAHNVTVTHLFPIEFEFLDTIGNIDGIYDNTVQTGKWYIPEIAPNQSCTLKLKTMATFDDDDLVNLINVDYTENHLNLTLKKASDKDEYFAGQTANITITITNNGGCNATNVTLNEVLHPEFAFNGTYTANMGRYDSKSNKWMIDELKEGETATLNIYANTVITRGNVTNIIEISCNQIEWDYTNNIARKTVEVVPLPQPTKSVNNITPDYHDYIEYYLTIYNLGNTTYKKNLTITDTLPIGLDFVEFVSIVGADIVNQTNSSGSSVDHIVDGRKVIWIITNIENKSSAIITVKLHINALGKLITNTTVINSIYNLANNTELINKLIDLTNNVTFMKELLDETGNSTFIKGIINLTHDGSTFNKLIELVNNESYVKAIGKLTNETFKNELINLTNNSVGINSIGNLTNNLTVTGPNGTNYTDHCSVYPRTVVDISVNITSDKDEYFVDDIAIWTITVSNAGNATNATNVTLKNLFPSQYFEFINCTLANGSSFTGDTWYIGNLGNGTNVTFKVYSRAIKDGINVTHEVSVSCNETEWNVSNNKANKTVDVVIIPYPVKTVNNITPYYNDVIEYNITLFNKGFNVYSSTLNVTDSLPDGLIFNGTYRVIGANESGAFVNVNNQTLAWFITNITGKSNATIMLYVKVVGLGEKIYNGTFISGLINDGAVKYIGNLTNNVTVTGPNGTKN